MQHTARQHAIAEGARAGHGDASANVIQSAANCEPARLLALGMPEHVGDASSTIEVPRQSKAVL